MGFTEFAKKVAPWIATVAGIAVPGASPFLSMAAKALSTGLGKDIKPDGDSIQNAIAKAMANPDQLAKLKQIDDDFALQMRALGIQEATDYEKIAADDRASARNREIQVRDYTPRVLAAVVLIACFAAEGYVLTHGYPSTVAGELVGRILGTLDAAVMLVLSYYFGSSAGSDRKTELMAQAAPAGEGTKQGN